MDGPNLDETRNIYYFRIERWDDESPVFIVIVVVVVQQHL